MNNDKKTFAANDGLREIGLLENVVNHFTDKGEKLVVLSVEDGQEEVNSANYNDSVIIVSSEKIIIPRRKKTVTKITA